MAVKVSAAVIQNNNWVKCSVATDIHLKNNLLEILHNKTNGLPEDPKDLYTFFQNNRKNIGRKGSKKKLQLFPDQLNIILPPQGNEVDSKSCDITLIVALIKAFIPGCPYLLTVDKAREFRNNLKHGTIEDIQTEQQLQTKITEIRNLLTQMNYSKLQEFKDMVNDDKFLIDSKDLTTYLTKLKNDLLKDCDDKIEHKKKIMMTEIINQLKPRLKGKHLQFHGRFIIKISDQPKQGLI